MQHPLSNPRCRAQAQPVTRREFLRRTGLGMGGLAFAALLAQDAERAGASDAKIIASASGLEARLAPLPCKAKHVIHIFAGGAPSQVDTFDPKPALEAHRDSTLDGQSGVVFPSPFKFMKSGKSGLEISEIFPQLQGVADELCVVRSMVTDVPAHGPASQLLLSGNAVLKRPSMGSWVLYGLGTENQNLPGFIALGGDGTSRQAAFLPPLYQGTLANFAPGRPVDQVLLNLHNDFNTPDEQQLQLELLHKLDSNQGPHDEQLETRIQSFELAFRMQTEATDAFDLSKEPQAVRDRYGKGLVAGRLLAARRLVERGVRFVQVEAGGWDHHDNLTSGIKRTAEAIDRPVAALLADLRERGLLDSTLVIWGGEFGRTITTPGAVRESSGRDHHAGCFSVWMAGGGVKGGMAYGASDELGTRASENPVHVHDLHATILRLLGFDHKKLTFRYNGRDFRLTDNYGNVVQPIIA